MTDRKIAVGLFFMTWFVYSYFFGGGGWNQNVMLDLTRAVVERRTLRIDGYHRNTGDVAVFDNHVYSNKPPGVSFLAAIPYAAIHVFSSGNPDEWKVLTRNAWIVTVLVCGLMGALISAFLYLFSVRELHVSRGWSMALAAIVAFGTPVFAYSTMLFLHVPSALLTLLAFVWSRDSRDSRIGAAGAAAGLNALCNFVAIPLLPIFLLRSMWQSERPLRRAVAFTAGATPFLLLFAWYQILVYGSVFRNPANLNPAFTRSDAAEVLGPPSLEALAGITVSPYRGLFFLSPILVFALAGLIVMFRRRATVDALTIVAVCLAFIGVNICFNNWNAGSAIGPRYILPIIPLLGIAMANVTGWWKPLWIALAIVSISHNVVATAVDPQVPITIENPLFDYEYPLFLFGSLAPEVPIQPPWLTTFLVGHTSVNRQSVDEILPLIRHVPTSFEAEWASFNLGEWIVGPGTPWSLVPLLLVLVAAGFVLYRTARRA